MFKEVHSVLSIPFRALVTKILIIFFSICIVESRDKHMISFGGLS